MMVRRAALAFAIVLYVGTAACQSSLAVNEVSATGGSIVLNGYTSINIDADGKATSNTDTNNGAAYVLNPGGGFYSPFFGDATCAYVGFSSNYSTITAFVTTKSNLQEMLSGGTLDYSKAKPLASANWKSERSANSIIATNSADTYVFVAINTGGQGQNGGTTSSTTIAYRVAVYDKSSSVCQNANNGGTPTSNQSVRDNPNLVPYNAEDSVLLFKESRPYAVIDSASCLSFQVLPQASGSTGSLDLSFFVSSLSSSLSWVSGGYQKSLPSIGSALYQQSSATATSPTNQIAQASTSTPAGTSITVSRSQAGQVNIDGLDPKTQYVIWGINGQNSQSGNRASAFVRYSAKAQGSCSTVAFPDPTGVTSLGSTVNIFTATNYKSTGGGAEAPPTPSSTPASTPAPSSPSTPTTPGSSTPGTGGQNSQNVAGGGVVTQQGSGNSQVVNSNSGNTVTNNTVNNVDNSTTVNNSSTTNNIVNNVSNPSAPGTPGGRKMK